LIRVSSVTAQAVTPSEVQKGAPQAIGRSRGGLSTKIHTTVDALGNPTGFHLTPGQAHDLEGAEAGKAVVIPPRSTRKDQRDYDQHLYKSIQARR